MSPEQLNALGDVTIEQVNKTVTSARELSEEIDRNDIIAIVAPIGLQAEFLRLAGEKPVIVAVSDGNGGESKVEFVFKKWERIRKIEVVKEDFNPEDY